VLLILAVPTVALMVLAGVGVISQFGVDRAASSTVPAVRLVLVTQGLVHELQAERGLSNGFLGGQQRYRAQIDQRRAAADEARRQLESALEAAPAEAAAPVGEALERLEDLDDVRADVDARTADRAATLEFYTAAISDLAEASGSDHSDIADGELQFGVEALRALGQLKESTALERGFLNGVFSADAFGDREYVTFVEIRAGKLANQEEFSGDATDSQQAALDAALRSPEAGIAHDLEQRAIDGQAAKSLGVDADRWWDVTTVVVDDLRAIQQQVGADVEARAVALSAEARTVLVLNLVLALAALAGAAGLGVITARSIIGPLRLLAADAHDVATTRLPDTVAQIQAATGGPAGLPPPPRTVAALEQRDDEIAEVSRALNQVQRTAVELATEQALLRRNAAESLSNLARRNQNLLRRQLGFISDLERDESDPRALGDLFELDHLATRMRRNAESLLVLVGERSPRQWSQPVPISDVIRAALSEVEEYRRVGLRRLDETLVAGTAGAELAHLIAELVENGLSFSPPDREVEVYGQLSGATYVIAVVDHGIGMAADELAGANARLRGEETFLVAPTRFLGHYVVGQLAGRLGVDVRLHESPLTGITARVTVPETLLSAPAHSEDLFAAAAPAVLEPIVGARPFRLGRETPPSAPVAVLEMQPAPAPARTRNGLVKRVRSTDEVGVEPAPSAAEATAGAQRRQDEDIRTTLTSFRAGFDRREHERFRPDGDDPAAPR
jgi:hypothetical protein